MHSKFRIITISFAFIGCLSFPLLNNYFKICKDIESFENRRLATEPEFDPEHLDPYPAKYEVFYKDNFTLRNRLIQYYNLYKIIGFHQSPLPDKVVIGKNGWLFNVGEEMDSYMGKNRLSPNELESYKLELEYRQKYLGDRGIKFYFMPVPCKASIYGEFIGYEYYRMFKDSWGEQLTSYLKNNSSVKPIDIFDTLRKVKTPFNLYYKLDNHWNSLGAFYAANAVIEFMRKDFPGLTPLALDNYTIRSRTSYDGNIQQMLGDLNFFSEERVELSSKTKCLSEEGKKADYPPIHGFAYPSEYEAVREIKNSKAPKLLIISDSFGGYLFPYISEHFSKTVKIFDAWSYKLNEDIVESEKPDAVLLMIDEPILRNLLGFQSRPKK